VTNPPPADPAAATARTAAARPASTRSGSARANRSGPPTASVPSVESGRAERGTDTPTSPAGEAATSAKKPTATSSTAKKSTGTTTPAGATTTEPAPAEADDGAGTESTVTRLLGYRRQRFEARKVRRLVRHIDPWSMLKLSLLVSLCMWLMVMIAAVILWTVARNAGTIASVEDFVNSSLSLQDWSLDGEFIFRQFGLVTLLLCLGFAASVVIATLVFNLVSDIIGGVWISVIEEETARPVAESNR